MVSSRRQGLEEQKDLDKEKLELDGLRGQGWELTVFPEGMQNHEEQTFRGMNICEC